MIPIALAAGLAVAAYVVHQRRYRPVQPTFVGSSKKLEGTEVMTYLDSPLPENKSALWCVSLELAWRKAMAEVFQGPIQLENHQAVADRLNASRANWDGLPADQLQLEVKRLGDDPDVSISKVTGCLTVRVPFTVPFFDSQLEFGQESVRCFGIRPEDAGVYRSLRQQVAVLFDHGDPRQFAIDPCTSSSPFRLIVAAVKAQASLHQTIESVRQQCRDCRERGLGSQDSLLIPQQSWDIQHPFDELCGAIVRPPYGGRLDLQQRIRFQLDRSGAELFSQVDLLAAFMSSAGPKQFHFDRPFLMYIESRATSQVVLAAWIDNTELLVPAGW